MIMTKLLMVCVVVAVIRQASGRASRCLTPETRENKQHIQSDSFTFSHEGYGSLHYKAYGHTIVGSHIYIALKRLGFRVAKSSLDEEGTSAKSDIAPRAWGRAMDIVYMEDANVLIVSTMNADDTGVLAYLDTDLSTAGTRITVPGTSNQLHAMAVYDADTLVLCDKGDSQTDGAIIVLDVFTWGPNGAVKLKEAARWTLGANFHPYTVGINHFCKIAFAYKNETTSEHKIGVINRMRSGDVANIWERTLPEKAGNIIGTPGWKAKFYVTTQDSKSIIKVTQGSSEPIQTLFTSSTSNGAKLTSFAMYKEKYMVALHEDSTYNVYQFA